MRAVSQESDGTAAQVKRELYRRMLLMRRTEERIVANYHLREMRSPPHISIGQEAVAAGVSTALRKDDLVFPYYRSHGWYIAKRGDLAAMVAELHGREGGCSGGWGGSMHLIDPEQGIMGTSAIVGGTIPHAAGAALAFRMQGKDSIVAVSFGDGAVEEGVFHETMNFAALRKLALIFVCENNLYATNTHIRDRQAQTEIHRRAEGYGMPGFVVDGNDAFKVHALAVAARNRARAGDGPTLIECRTYRYLEHCGVFEDHHLGYRTKEEVDAWRARDPLSVARDYVTEADRERFEEEIRTLIDEAFRYARSSPFPESLFAYGF